MQKHATKIKILLSESEIPDVQKYSIREHKGNTRQNTCIGI